MTSTKNAAPSQARPPLLTDAIPFFQLCIGDPESGLLQVCSGKPAHEALDCASLLMHASIDLMVRLTDHGMSTNEIYGIRFLLESSAALVDASARSVEFGNEGGES
jgi:hypothetical protein